MTNNIPSPLLTSEPGSFAQNTIATRKPAVIRRVLTDHANQYPPEIVAALEALLAEIEERKPIEPLRTTAPDGPDWAAAFQPHAGKTWFDIPWYFAETFLYRRLVEATGYFGSDNEAVNRWQSIDPFLPQKQAELASDTPWQVLAAALTHSNDNTDPSFHVMLHHTLWGNRVDLSYNKVAEDSGRDIAIEQELANLLVDDSTAVIRHVQQLIVQRTGKPRRIDFICDNSGTELLLDLALADYFLCFGWLQQVTLHVKFHPFFVSDATPTDVEMHLAAIAARTEPPLVADLGRRLQRYQAEGRLIIRDDIFWNSPRFFWELPDTLRSELAQAQLVVIKGDANYRRLLDDSRWPTATPLADIVTFFPAPFVCLRTMKSDPVVGLAKGQAEALNAEDPQWRVNGKRGMIQALLK